MDSTCRLQWREIRVALIIPTMSILKVIMQFTFEIFNFVNCVKPIPVYNFTMYVFLKIRRETISKPNVSYVILDSLFSLEDQDRAFCLSFVMTLFYLFHLYNYISNHTLAVEGINVVDYFDKSSFLKEKFLPYLSQKKKIRNIYYRKQDRRESKNDQ